MQRQHFSSLFVPPKAVWGIKMQKKFKLCNLLLLLVSVCSVIAISSPREAEAKVKKSDYKINTYNFGDAETMYHAEYLKPNKKTKFEVEIVHKDDLSQANFKLAPKKFKISISNKKVCRIVKKKYDAGGENYVVTLKALKKGSATVTIKWMGYKYPVHLTVSNDPYDCIKDIEKGYKGTSDYCKNDFSKCIIFDGKQRKKIKKFDKMQLYLYNKIWEAIPSNVKDVVSAPCIDWDDGRPFCAVKFIGDNSKSTGIKNRSNKCSMNYIDCMDGRNSKGVAVGFAVTYAYEDNPLSFIDAIYDVYMSAFGYHIAENQANKGFINSIRKEYKQNRFKYGKYNLTERDFYNLNDVWGAKAKKLMKQKKYYQPIEMEKFLYRKFVYETMSKIKFFDSTDDLTNMANNISDIYMAIYTGGYEIDGMNYFNGMTYQEYYDNIWTPAYWAVSGENDSKSIRREKKRDC